MIDANAPGVWFDSIDSTNEEARRRVEHGDTLPLWIAAGSQSGGRGRRGRSWLSHAGNLFQTYVTSTDKPAAEIALLGFTTALAISDGILADNPDAPVQIKWPNDVLWGGAKVSGVLLESGGLKDGRLWFAIGVGVNCATAPALADYQTTSLAAHGVQTNAQDFGARLRVHMAARAQELADKGFAPIRESWMRRAFGLGAPVRTLIGAEEIVGVAEDLGSDGALLVRTRDGGIRSISAGEVYFT